MYLAVFKPKGTDDCSGELSGGPDFKNCITKLIGYALPP
jgi:hypothetical protein